MAPTGDKCPHCTHQLHVPRLDIPQEVNCPNCGRLLLIAARARAQRPPDLRAGGEAELLLVLTVACVFANMITDAAARAMANALFGGTLLLLFIALIIHCRTLRLFPRALAPGIEQYVKRLRVFPYEALLVPGWAVLVGISLGQSPWRESVGSVLLIAALILMTAARKAFRKADAGLALAREACLSDLFAPVLRLVGRGRLTDEAEVDAAPAAAPLSAGSSAKGAAARRTSMEGGAAPATKHAQAQQDQQAASRFMDWIDEESTRLKNR